jgi:hypothetical protein
MSEKDQEKDGLADVNNLEIEPLSDEALESVAGGLSDGSSGSCCSCCGCSATTPAPTEESSEICASQAI